MTGYKIEILPANSGFRKDALIFTASCGIIFHKQNSLSCNVGVFYLVPLFVIQI
jgi:hypothetical protein